ncbi:conserved Plasmodium protein, unknown function [Plasmodium relictum]|uniref:FPL domain-containing protein n=1 Tax=Plasmodium relictum TaxID=85471 RepID=A0A1J1H7R4_PLARL|nr:conserved Plasmodium protein, unknown function [Plasmodium relictum]CRH00946.1 conserved Plasmodium protein, unknown function [Plasmodium relictum]
MWNFFNFNNFDDRIKNYKNEKEIYTHEDLRYYFEKLVKINLSNVNVNNFIELLRKITQITIWGDKHDDQIFQYFCEDNIFNHFIYLLKQKINKNIRIQIYQSLTLLIQNLQKDISLYYIFSNNKINNLIYTTFIYQDDEIIPYYISMIKSISFFLNYHTSKFFFNEKSMKFPLYTESLRLYKFNDIITRTYIKNIILNILKIEDEGIENLILLRSSFFTILVCYLRNNMIKMNKVYTKIKESKKLKNLFNNYLDEIDDVLYFFEDMFNCKKKRINDMLIVKLLIYFYFPIISSFNNSIYFDGVNSECNNSFYTSGQTEENLFNKTNSISTNDNLNYSSIDYVYFSNQKNINGQKEKKEISSKDSNDEKNEHEEINSKDEKEEEKVISDKDERNENKEKDKNKTNNNGELSKNVENEEDEKKKIKLKNNENEKSNDEEQKDRNDKKEYAFDLSSDKLRNIHWDSVPFLTLVNDNFKSCKNFDFCKSLPSSNESSINSSLSYTENKKAEKNYYNTKKEKISDNNYEFLYFKGRSNEKKENNLEKNNIEETKNSSNSENINLKKKMEKNNKDMNFIKENELEDYYFKKRTRKIFIQLNSRNGILHKKKKKKNQNTNNCSFFKHDEDMFEIKKLTNNSNIINEMKKNNLYDICHVEIPTLQKKITFDENVNNDIFNYLFNFNCFTLNMLNFYNGKLSITNIFYNIFKVGLYFHPLCYVNSFKNFSLLYNYIMNISLSLFILIRSLNILKNDKINKIIYSLIFDEHINAYFLHRILSNELDEPYFYNYFFDTHKKTNVNKTISDDIEFEYIYSSSIDYLLPEYNKEEENAYLNLINNYYNQTSEKNTKYKNKEKVESKKENENDRYEKEEESYEKNEEKLKIKEIKEEENLKLNEISIRREIKEMNNNILRSESDIDSDNKIMKYNELSNPIFLNFLLLTNIQKEKNIKKCEKENIKNKISDIYLLLSIQFIYNFIKNTNDDLNSISINFFKISNYNFIYVFWDIINIHINNLNLRIITLKLLINLTLLYVQKISDKNVCINFCIPLLNLIKKIKKKLANKIKNIINKMDYKVCQIFWEEYKIYENCYQEKINLFCDSILINIVNEIDESGENNFLCCPVSQIEIYRRNVHALFVLNGVSNKLQKIISNTKNEPLNLIPFDFNNYNIKALIDIKNKNTIKCYLKNNNKIFNCYYIEDKNNFLLCIPSNTHVNQALIIFSHPLMLIDLYIDKNDNKKLIAHVYSYNNEENNTSDSSFMNFNNSEKVFNSNSNDNNYNSTVRYYSSNNDDNISDDHIKIHKNDYVLNTYSSTYKKNKTITSMKKEWCYKELNFMKNILKLNFYDTTRSLIVYKELKSGIQNINDKNKKKLEEYLSSF